MKSSLLTFSARNATGTTLYITLVALFLSRASDLFGSASEKAILIPIAMLLLFVVSASITGSLVLGQPILWYLDGKKKDAITLLFATIGFLALAMVFAFITLGFIA